VGLQGVHGVGYAGQRRITVLLDNQSMAQRAEGAPRPTTAESIKHRRVGLVDNERVGDRVERLKRIEQDQVFQRSWTEVRAGQRLRGSLHPKSGILRRHKLGLAVVVAELLELVQLVVAKLGRDEQMSGFENAQARGSWHSIKVLDLECEDFLLVVLDGHFVQVALLGLEEEKERALHLVHHC
jgi:hypothetical protein